MGVLKAALEAAMDHSIADAEIIGMLKGEISFDRPTAEVLLENADLAMDLSHASGITSAQMYETYMRVVQIGGATREEMADHPEVVRRKVGSV